MNDLFSSNVADVSLSIWLKASRAVMVLSSLMADIPLVLNLAGRDEQRFHLINHKYRAYV